MTTSLARRPPLTCGRRPAELQQPASPGSAWASLACPPTTSPPRHLPIHRRRRTGRMTSPDAAPSLSPPLDHAPASSSSTDDARSSPAAGSPNADAGASSPPAAAPAHTTDGDDARRQRELAAATTIQRRWKGRQKRSAPDVKLCVSSGLLLAKAPELGKGLTDGTSSSHLRSSDDRWKQALFNAEGVKQGEAASEGKVRRPPARARRRSSCRLVCWLTLLSPNSLSARLPSASPSPDPPAAGRSRIFPRSAGTELCTRRRSCRTARPSRPAAARDPATTPARAPTASRPCRSRARRPR